jgi:hypothetical protein
MKHGDKKKASKSAGKKSSKASKSKVVKSVQAKNVKAKSSSSSKSSKAAGKTRDNGAASRARSSGDTGFSNPTVASAFKTAVKKYPNTFRKLTD